MPVIRSWWISCPKFTVQVWEQAGRICDAAPIVRKFIGQDLSNLIRWAKKFGEVRVEELCQQATKSA